jgi:hypothetical protein
VKGLSLKDDSINPRGMTPELCLGLMIVSEVFLEFELEFVITSLNDGQHSYNSAHYEGNAADIRTRHIPAGIEAPMANKIQRRLNKHYDFVFENNHLHLEYDPKRPG